MSRISLRKLQKKEVDTFVMELQRAFDKAVIEKHGPQKESVIPREHIEHSLNAKNAQAFRILAGGNGVGGVVVQIDAETQHNSLDLLYINPECHSRGIGQKVWQLIEKKYPETKVWETHTPYFEIRNIHFYVNRLGFHIVEFFNAHHPEPHEKDHAEENQGSHGDDGFFRFEKVMKPRDLHMPQELFKHAERRKPVKSGGR